MCGIAGSLVLHGRAEPPARETLDRMVDALAHRGPDGRGTWHGPGIALGHRRLAILDLSEAAAQPMRDGTGKVVVTYNGELYNFRELRADLERRGHAFRTSSDTEVLLASYLEWGPECLERFNGIFAFGLWDGRRDRLWLARDRLGVKPLYYGVHGGVLRFGSEPKAVLADRDVDRTPSPAGLSAFLSFGFVPAPLTGFEGIQQLPAAHYLMAEDGRVETRRYWQPPEDELEIGFDEAVEEFAARLRAAVRGQLVSDVPVGAFLSGGLDSAAVVAQIAGQTPEPVRTFCVGFSEASFDERPNAEETARLFGTRHTTDTVATGLAEGLEAFVRYCEDPFADSSSVAVYQLCRVARRQVTVALSGDGADELLAGYPTYTATRLAGHWRRLPALVRRPFRALALSAPASDLRYSPQEFAARFVQGADEPEGRDHASWRLYFRDADKQAMLKKDFLAQAKDYDPVGHYADHYVRLPKRWPPLKRMLRADLEFYLPNDMLVKVDRMSMAWGLEVRVPFLDHELVEFCCRLPARHLYRFGRGKRILKAYLARHVSTRIARRPKRGFNVPVGRALRGSLGDRFTEAVTAEPFRSEGPFETRALLELLEGHRRRRRDAGHALFTALLLALWWQEHVAG